MKMNYSIRSSGSSYFGGNNNKEQDKSKAQSNHMPKKYWKYLIEMK
jgi:hypothetical protein